MSVFKNCLLVSDIDGTLYENNTIPKINLDAIEYFKSEGGYFTVATGRGKLMAKNVCKQALVNAPALLTNGSVIYDSITDRVLYTEYLEKDAKEFAKRIIEEFPEIGIEVTTDDGIITISENEATVNHRKVKYFESKISSYETAERENWIKYIAMSEDKELLKRVKNYMDKNRPHNATLVATSPIFYEVLPLGTDKGKNLSKLAKTVNADKIFCIGDYYNDVGMVKKATVGAFTKNAPEDIKCYADYITTDVKDGAVADFIKYLKTVLEERKSVDG